MVTEDANGKQDPEPPSSAPDRLEASLSTDGNLLDALKEILDRSGEPLENKIWQTYSTACKSLARVLGFEYEHMELLPGTLFGFSGHNVYVDWLFRISDEPLTPEQLLPPDHHAGRTGAKVEPVRLGHGEFANHIRPELHKAKMWLYDWAICDTYGSDAEVQQKLIDTSDNAVPRDAPLGYGPTINKQQYQVPCVVPHKCDPRLLDQSDRESTYGRSLVMHLRDGCTAEQAAHVIARLLELSVPEQRFAFAVFLLDIATAYGNIQTVLLPHKETIMAEITQLTGGALGDGITSIRPEQVERFEAWVPEELIRRISYVRESEAKRQESEAKRQESEAKRQDSEVRLKAAKDVRISDLVRGLSLKGIVLEEHMLDQLRMRPLDELPSVSVALDASSRKEFMYAAGLLNGAPVPFDSGAGSDSDE